MRRHGAGDTELERPGEIELEPFTGKLEPQPTPLTLAEPDERRDFVRKVYGILSAQLLVTLVLAGAMVWHGHEWLRSRPGAVLAVVNISCAVSLVVSVLSSCCPHLLRRYPQNYALLGTFTVAESVLLGFACLQYTVGSVLVCLAITCAVVAGLTVYANRTKSDFTTAGPYLCCCLLSLFCSGLVLSILAMCGLASTAMFGGLQLLYAAGGALLFSAFLVYDMQLILGGDHAHEFSVDDYAMAALCVYLDIIQLFLSLLRLIGERSNDGL